MLILVILVTFSFEPANLIAEDVVDKELLSYPCMYEETNEDCVKRLVDKYAKEYKVSASSMMRTLKNENNTFDFDAQSNLKYKKGNRWKFPAGTREKSYGICQIHLPDHPYVSYDQATNPEFCVEFMAKNFAKGKQRMWMGYEG